MSDINPPECYVNLSLLGGAHSLIAFTTFSSSFLVILTIIDQDMQGLQAVSSLIFYGLFIVTVCIIRDKA